MKTVNRKLNFRRRLENRLRALFGYFRKARIRLERMPETPAATEDLEQAGYAHLDSIILACSYLDALSVFCFGEGRNGFIRFLQDYSNPEEKRWYRKISCLYLDQPPLDKAGNLRRSLKASDVTSVRRTLYRNASPDTKTDLSIDEAVSRLACAHAQKNPKWLNQFSYAAYLYERYRCHGVHNVQPPSPGVSGRPEPYYEGRPDRLVIPRRFILDTLTGCIENFETEALEKLKGGPAPDTADDYRWLKEAYDVKSTFIETVCQYYRPGPNTRVPAAPRGSAGR